MNDMSVVITGAAKRLGKAIALHCSSLGARVILHYNSSKNDAVELQQCIQKNGGKAEIYHCDLSDVNRSKELIDFTIDTFGSVDVLINSASIFPEDTFENFSLESIQDNFSVNTLSPLMLIRQFTHYNKNGGSVINFLDTRITEYDANHFSYHLSKRSFYTITRALAKELAPQIRVNGIAPGPVLAPVNKGKEHIDKVVAQVPLKRMGNPDHISKSVQFLIENDFITGQIIYVDGGYHLEGNVYGL